jgi:hypothetical protein
MIDLCHHWCFGDIMRLTVRLDNDVYSFALAISKSENISLAEAINRLVRKAGKPKPLPNRKQHRQPHSFPTSVGRQLITSEDVKQAEIEEARNILESSQ